MSDKKFYLTTAIAYLNSVPHIGHALEIIQADCIARYYRLLDHKVVFQTGTDEHGIKVYKAAQAKGVDTKSFVDKNCTEFINLYKALNISYDKFVRTTSEVHEKGVVKFWNKLIESGDLYLNKYSSLYCEGCEAYLTQSELVDNKCPNHPNREITPIDEENYYFKLGKYRQKIVELIDSNTIEIVPAKFKNELLAFLKGEVHDISFSRRKEILPWGIPVPNDPNQVIYVWADALSNYITNVGYEYNKKEFESTWPVDIHIIGKDITKFHAIYWPAMLLSAGVPLPKKIFVHSFILMKNQKMSKSLGNVVDPNQLVAKYGADVLRFYLLNNITTYDDGNFDEDELVTSYNNLLADDLGNLLQRVLTFVEEDFNNQIPTPSELTPEDQSFIESFNFVNELTPLFEQYQLNQAVVRVWSLIRDANQYFTKTSPWKLRKDKDIKRLATVIYVELEALKAIALYIAPFIPSTSQEILKRIGITNRLSFSDISYNPNRKGQVTKGQILFPKKESKEQSKQKLTNKKGSDAVKAETKDQQVSADKNYATIDDLAKLRLRVATIKAVTPIENSDKLLKVKIDLGLEEREIIAGIGAAYKPEELIERQIIVVTNLVPRKFKKYNVESNGMLLAAGDGEIIALLQPDKKLPPGSEIH